MAKRKHFNFKAAMENGTILTGVVRVAEVHPQKENSLLKIDCAGKKVIIPGKEIVPLKFGQSISNYTGKEVDFIVTEVSEEVDLIFGSCVKAAQKKEAPILEKLFAGEVIEGVIANLVDHGAYINIGGAVEGLMKNIDFSDDGTCMKDVCNVGESIRIKYLKTSSKGTFIFVPEKVRHGSSALTFEDLARHQHISGTVVSVYPDRVYVNILPGIDCMCENPKNIDQLKEYEKVTVVLIKVDQEKRRVRGAIKDVLDR